MEQQNLPPCPEIVKERAAILHANGFGFRDPARDTWDYFALARVDEVMPNLNKIMEISGTKTLIQTSFIENYYIDIHWTEYNKIEFVLNAMLTLAIPFTTMTNLNCFFDPKKERIYSKEIEEIVAIKTVEDYMKKGDIFDFKFLFEIRMIKHCWLEIWNWRTAEGREFCKKLVNTLHRGSLDYADKDNYYNWEGFLEGYDWTFLIDFNKKPETKPLTIDCNNKPATEPIKLDSCIKPVAAVEVAKLDSINKSQVEHAKDNSEEDNTCMICMTNIPDTFILPCEHCVVCKKCSIELRNTNDAKICVRCRRPITHVLE